MTRVSWIELTLLFSIIAGVRCLEDTKLEIVPDIVERGGETVLSCSYKEEEEPIYTLKWYRGKREFYRYAPGMMPTLKNFTLEGVHVDLAKSNESQVTIRAIDYSASGNYSCEITTDRTFTTEAGYHRLLVVSLPQGRPVIASEKERYDLGDTLKANCTVPRSTPPVNLSFTLNNKPVGHTQKQHKSNRGSNEGLKLGPGSYNVHQQKQHDQPYGDLQWHELSLTLQPFHYVNGQLTLRCIALIPEIYNASAELQLGTGLREPVPERVTSENSGTVTSVVSLTLLSLTIVRPLLRQLLSLGGR